MHIIISHLSYEFFFYIAVTTRSHAPTVTEAAKDFVLAVFKENGVEKEATVPNNWLTEVNAADCPRDWPGLQKGKSVTVVWWPAHLKTGSDRLAKYIRTRRKPDTSSWDMLLLVKAKARGGNLASLFFFDSL